MKLGEWMIRLAFPLALGLAGVAHASVVVPDFTRAHFPPEVSYSSICGNLDGQQGFRVTVEQLAPQESRLAGGARDRLTVTTAGGESLPTSGVFADYRVDVVWMQDGMPRAFEGSIEGSGNGEYLQGDLTTFGYDQDSATPVVLRRDWPGRPTPVCGQEPLLDWLEFSGVQE